MANENVAGADILTFTTDNYTGELRALWQVVDRIDDETIKSDIVERVNRMQAMLRPVVDQYLVDHNGADNRGSASIEELMKGPDSRG